VRAVDAFVDGLDLDGLGFIHVQLHKTVTHVRAAPHRRRQRPRRRAWPPSC
jgi:hypothetical protein